MQNRNYYGIHHNHVLTPNNSKKYYQLGVTNDDDTNKILQIILVLTYKKLNGSN